jgi:3-dehydrosphinganine reductase
MELRPINIGISVVFPPDTDTIQYAQDTKMRPKEIELLARITSLVKPELVAYDILKGISHGDYYIFPGRGTRLWFLLNGWVNGTMNRVIEYLISRARKNMS